MVNHISDAADEAVFNNVFPLKSDWKRCNLFTKYFYFSGGRGNQRTKMKRFKAFILINISSTLAFR